MQYHLAIKRNKLKKKTQNLWLRHISLHLLPYFFRPFFFLSKTLQNIASICCLYFLNIYVLLNTPLWRFDPQYFIGNSFCQDHQCLTSCPNQWSVLRYHLSQNVRSIWHKSLLFWLSRYHLLLFFLFHCLS